MVGFTDMSPDPKLLLVKYAAGNLQIPSATTFGVLQYSQVYEDVSPIV